MVEQNRFGTIIPSADQPTPPANAFPLPPPGYAPAPTPGYAYPPAAPARGRRPAVIAAIVVGGLVAALALAAGARTVVENREADAVAARTTISFPTDVDGLTLMSGDVDQLVQGEVAAVPHGFGTPKGAAYGTGGTAQAIVIAGVHPMTPGAQGDFLKGLGRSFTQQGISSQSFLPGPLGGRLVCGPLPGAAKTVCGFTDGGSYGAIAVVGVGPSAVTLALAIRSAVERRS